MANAVRKQAGGELCQAQSSTKLRSKLCSVISEAQSAAKLIAQVINGLIFGQQNLWSKKSWSHKIFGQNYCWGGKCGKFFLVNDIFGPNKYWAKAFWSKIIFDYFFCQINFW